MIILVGAAIGLVLGLANLYRENTKDRREAERRAGVNRFLETLERKR